MYFMKNGEEYLITRSPSMEEEHIEERTLNGGAAEGNKRDEK
jgi:hypothetical protein